MLYLLCYYKYFSRGHGAFEGGTAWDTPLTMKPIIGTVVVIILTLRDEAGMQPRFHAYSQDV